MDVLYAISNMIFDSKHFIIIRLEKLIQNILNKVSSAMIKFNISFENYLKLKVHVDIMILIRLFCTILHLTICIHLSYITCIIKCN